MTTVRVSERIEMAHRLHRTEGNCSNIHGHTWTIWLELSGTEDENGIVVDFRHAKVTLRDVLKQYDHALLLGEDDPLNKLNLPGTISCPIDATTEMFAKEIHRQLAALWNRNFNFGIEVWETPTNVVRYP